MSHAINPSVRVHRYASDAIRIAKHVALNGALPGDLRSYDFANAFRFATGRIPQGLLEHFDLGVAASFGDLGRAIERKLSPPKWEPDAIVIDGRRPEAIKAGRQPRPRVRVEQAVQEPEASEAPALEWRDAVNGEGR